MAQEGPKRGPREPQDGPKSAQERPKRDPRCGFVNVDDNLDGVLGYREVDDVRSVDLTSSFLFQHWRAT